MVADWVREYEALLAAVLVFACLLMIAVQYWTRPRRRPHRPGRHRSGGES